MKRNLVVNVKVFAEDGGAVVDALRAAIKLLCEHGLESIGGGHNTYSYRITHEQGEMKNEKDKGVADWLAERMSLL